MSQRINNLSSESSYLDSVEALKESVDNTHEKFLRAEEQNDKLKALKNMCAISVEFLFVAPHNDKFIFKETEDVLRQSAMNIEDFDPVKGSLAFKMMAKYAQNILEQPWRKEFYTVKLYAGFYVHNIKRQLTNAQEIFVAMGYVQADETTMAAEVGKLDEMKLKSISRDMIVASEECLIMSEILKIVLAKEPEYPFSVGEIYEFRKKHIGIGNVKNMCKIILEDIRQRSIEHAGRKFSRKSLRCNEDNMDTDQDTKPFGTDSDTGEIINEIDADVLAKKVLENTTRMHKNRTNENANSKHFPGSNNFSNSQTSSAFNVESKIAGASNTLSSTSSRFNTYSRANSDSISSYISRLDIRKQPFPEVGRSSLNNIKIYPSGDGQQPLKFSKVEPEESGGAAFRVPKLYSSYSDSESKSNAVQTCPNCTLQIPNTNKTPFCANCGCYLLKL